MAGEGNHVVGPGLVDVLEVSHEAVAVPESDDSGNGVITAPSTALLNHLHG